MYTETVMALFRVLRPKAGDSVLMCKGNHTYHATVTAQNTQHPSIARQPENMQSNQVDTSRN